MPKGFFQFPLHVVEIHRCSFPSGNDIHVDRRKLPFLASEDFPDRTLDPIASDRAAHLLADRNSEACSRKIVRLPYKEKALYRNLAGRIK